MSCLNKRELSLNEMIPLFNERLALGGEVQISPKGISMLPMLRQGRDSVVLAKAPEKLKKYDIPLYQRHDGKYVLHRIVKVENNYTCIGDNQLIEEKNVEHCQIIAYVTAFYRDNKRYSINNPIYKAYCCLWVNSKKLRIFFKKIRNRIKRIIKK